jgi:hypothetical protein
MHTCYWHASVVRSRVEENKHENTSRRHKVILTTSSSSSSSTFLAELDLPTSAVLMLESSAAASAAASFGADQPAAATSPAAAQLVLGLNNHHVGSYYWARSAGAGAAMEAPGIELLVVDDDDSSSGGCQLHWASTLGPTACNSNDGKRSEWVNFLRPGDQVQLIPTLQSAEQSVLQWITMKGKPNDPRATKNAYATASSSLSSWGRIFGVSNYKRPLGSEPAVVCEWKLQ